MDLGVLSNQTKKIKSCSDSTYNLGVSTPLSGLAYVISLNENQLKDVSPSAQSKLFQIKPAHWQTSSLTQ